MNLTGIMTQGGGVYKFQILSLSSIGSFGKKMKVGSFILSHSSAIVSCEFRKLIVESRRER